MALTPGTRLGVYDVTAQIGVGGMGEVYRATDTRLKRQVAINSNETGQNEVHVQAFPSGAGRWQVSTSGGVFPRWRGDGRELGQHFLIPRPTKVADVTAAPIAVVLNWAAA